VKMVHNGIEYGMMASLAEGLTSCACRIGTPLQQGDAETRRCESRVLQVRHRHPDVAEVWREAASSAPGCWT